MHIVSKSTLAWLPQEIINKLNKTYFNTFAVAETKESFPTCHGKKKNRILCRFCLELILQLLTSFTHWTAHFVKLKLEFFSISGYQGRSCCARNNCKSFLINVYPRITGKICTEWTFSNNYQWSYGSEYVRGRHYSHVPE